MIEPPSEAERVRKSRIAAFCCRCSTRDNNGYTSMPRKPPTPLVASSHPGEAFTKQEGIEWCVYKWDEETYEAENDISSLAISFLLLQATRFNLTGIMPDTTMAVNQTCSTLYIALVVDFAGQGP